MKTLLTLLLAAFTLSAQATEIRVKNDSQVDFKNVVVGGRPYGDIKKGATTDYKTWEIAYRYSSVSLMAEYKPMEIRPMDYVGETPLGGGHFTYVLTLKNGTVDIRAEKDDK